MIKEIVGEIVASLVVGALLVAVYKISQKLPHRDGEIAKV